MTSTLRVGLALCCACFSCTHTGACGGTLACSTCHVILEQDIYDSLDEPEDEEMDMLDLAFGLEDT